MPIKFKSIVVLAAFLLAGMSMPSRLHAATVELYRDTFACKKGWVRSTLWLWGKITGSSEFVTVQPEGSWLDNSGAFKLKVKDNRIGLYEKAEPSDADAKHDKYTMKIMRVMSKAEWCQRCASLKKTGFAGASAMLVGAFLASMSSQNKAGGPQVHNFAGIGAAFALSGLAALYYAWKRYAQVGEVNASETLQMLYNNQAIRLQSFPVVNGAANNNACTDYTMVTHHRVNEALDNYMNPQVNSFYCPVCLRSDDHRHDNSVPSEQFFWGKNPVAVVTPFNALESRFVVVNTDKHHLKDHNCELQTVHYVQVVQQ